MAIEFQSRAVQVTEGSGNKRFEGPGTFSGTIRTAEAAIKDWNLFFLSGDHAIKGIGISTSIINTDGPFLNWRVECTLVDNQNNPPPYLGLITILIIADIV